MRSILGHNKVHGTQMFRSLETRRTPSNIFAAACGMPASDMLLMNVPAVSELGTIVLPTFQLSDALFLQLQLC